MVIYLGADHRGFSLKEQLKQFLKEEGYELYDVGNIKQDDEDDYPDFAFAAASKVSAAPDISRAILVCGSGVGMCVVANKLKNIRASVCISPDHVIAARSHDAINTLCLASDFIDTQTALAMTRSFLATPFDRQDTHVRRVQKIFSIEENNSLTSETKE